DAVLHIRARRRARLNVRRGVDRNDRLFARRCNLQRHGGAAELAGNDVRAGLRQIRTGGDHGLVRRLEGDFAAAVLETRHRRGVCLPAHLLWVGRWLTLVWTAVLVAGAIAFRNQNTPVVQLALSIASITYGGLLGTYILGGLWSRARQRDVIVAIVVSVLAMTPVVLGVPWRWLPGLAWPWYVPLGTAVTVLMGMASSLVRR